jgi:hypothetical protein
MGTFNYPDKAAKSLASKMKSFRRKTEETATSEINPHAESDRSEVVRQIDWAKFDEIISQLEFVYDHRKKYGRQY